MEIYLIRHTTTLNEPGRIYGQADIPLESSFEQECEALRKLLPEKLDQVYSSPLSRCMRLAQTLNTANDILADHRLLEINFGNWELKKWDDVPKSELDPWMKDFVNVRVPGGENFKDLYTRLNLFMNELWEKEHQQVAVVTHAGVIRAFLAGILGMPLENAFKLPVSYGSVTKIRYSPENCFSSLEYLNRKE